MEEDFTEGLGGIEITPESIVIDYINGNPNASLSDISNLIQQTGADLDSLSATFGVDPAEARTAYNQALSGPSAADQAAEQAAAAQAEAATVAAQANTAALAATKVAETEVAAQTGLQNVLDFVSQGNKSDEDIYREMVKNDVSIEQAAAAVNYPIDEATARYSRAQEMVQIEDIAKGGVDKALKDFPNGIPDNLIARYVSETTDSAEKIAGYMDGLGLTPDDMSRATGLPLADVRAAYNQAKDGGAAAGTTSAGTGSTVAGTSVAGGTGSGASSGTTSVASPTAVGGRAGSGGQTGLSGADAL